MKAGDPAGKASEAMKRTFGEKVFNYLNLIFLFLFSIVLLIPVIYILKQSVDVGIATSNISLYPTEFSYVYYKMVLTDKGIYGPLMNTVIITAVGTLLAVSVNAAAAYPMSRADYKPNKFLVYYIVIVPMLFSGGLVPSFLLMRGLGLLNTLAVCILPAVASGWNIVLIRNFYKGIPESLTEAAKIDGAGEFYIFGHIILPLSKPVLAAIALFTGVGYWNSFTPSLMYNSDPTKYTFAVKLREMIAVQEDMSRQFEAMMQSMSMSASTGQTLSNEGLSAAMMIISIVPIIVVYPFLQKHFAAGLMAGSVKG